MPWMNESGWIYLCVSLTNPNSFKVGLTSSPNIYTRLGSTTDPFYILVRGYKVPDNYYPQPRSTSHSRLHNPMFYLEHYIHEELRKHFDNQYHTMTNKKSEWFEGNIGHGIGYVNYFFARTVNILDENGRYDTNTYTFDPIVGRNYFYQNLFNRFPYHPCISPLHDLFTKDPSLGESTMASALDIPYVE